MKGDRNQVYRHVLDVKLCLTLPTWGGGQNDPKRNKCLRNSENKKKNFFKLQIKEGTCANHLSTVEDFCLFHFRYHLSMQGVSFHL